MSTPRSRRARWATALRWPIIMWDFRRLGATWDEAYRFTHWCIWFGPDDGPTDVADARAPLPSHPSGDDRVNGSSSS
jgi:hypothetical protein